ncbi:TonB-dependent receptor [Methylocystis sp. JR02]|uniref:TonB-dependent receptor family protein n=1 Tax=Methylocystis sp. JR02 TaxID=3046284 RepID=UPI0024BB8CD2|nr:TonB-dependent receptor [Methylocystis sp. JR02]MDJ0449809.1 TonB-dependent receptor [Methylocystis sp. JR02]
MAQRFWSVLSCFEIRKLLPMCRKSLSAGASLLAIAIVANSHAYAQQNLPTIDISGQRQKHTGGRPAGAVPNRLAPNGPSAAPASSPLVSAQAAPGFSPEKLKLPIYREPTGQTVTEVSAKTFAEQPLGTVGDMLRYSPGVSFKQGNGPRDMTISIRGSGARVGGAIQRIILSDDGFRMAMPDGFSRADWVDPHAYAGFDVYRGPSSALFGNFAVGGAINFRTRSGAEINGVEAGSEGGSFGYVNNYVTIGKKIGKLDFAVFASDMRLEGFTLNNNSNTQTVNLRATYEVTPQDKVTFKFIHNQLYGELPARLSLNQYYANPFQRGCNAIAPALGVANQSCGGTSLFINGVNGASLPITATQSGWLRNDRFDALGLRWEHEVDASTVIRTTGIYYDKEFWQPIDTPVTYANVPGVDIRTDVTTLGQFLGRDLRNNVEVYYNSSRFTTNTKPLAMFGPGNVMPQPVNKLDALVSNFGSRFRSEYALAPTLTAVIGMDVEASRNNSQSDNLGYANVGNPFLPTSFSTVKFSDLWVNWAHEASLTWRPSSEWQVRARTSRGFGTPNYLAFFVDQQGNIGPNTGLKPQTNTGVDGGIVWTPNDKLTVSLTGFYEWWTDEILAQRPGAGKLTYQFNAPGSVHRGAEFAADYELREGLKWLVNYTYNNQVFTNYIEQRNSGGGAPYSANTYYLNRAGYKVPNVPAHQLTTRLTYDQPNGDFKGLGAFIEYIYQYSYYIDNGNQLTIPSYGLLNLNAHYKRELSDSFLKEFTAFVQVNNVLNQNWVAGATNLTNTLLYGFQAPGSYLAQNATGSIYAGAPISVQGGVKVKF